MKMNFELGDLFISSDNQLVMLSYINNQYMLIVISHNDSDVELDEFECLCSAGEIWDDRTFDTIDEMNTFIKYRTNSLTKYVGTIENRLSDVIDMKVK